MTADDAAVERFEEHFRAFVQRASTDNPVHAQIAHHFGYKGAGPMRRGKRLRPRLVMAAADACGGAPEETVFAASGAIELLHNYSLIHDDIEDGDRLRHGRETVWSTFGLAHGVNAGDAVGALAQLALAPVAAATGADVAFALGCDLANANKRMCEGQALDLTLEAGERASVDAYLEMIGGKTAALFACAGSFGARCARASDKDVERCADVGRLFGLAFQIQDDVAGIWGDARETGKPVDSDLGRRKKTYPVAWAIEHDPARAGTMLIEAYGKSGMTLDAATVDALRDALERSGARDAARRASDDCLARAFTRASGDAPLEAFLSSARPA